MKKSDRIRVWNKYRQRCAYCGKLLEYKDMQVDHIIPRLGGRRPQKMEEALRAILIEATRVERGNFVSLVDDLAKIRDIAYEGLEGSDTRR